jgi:hypothetical protein
MPSIYSQSDNWLQKANEISALNGGKDLAGNAMNGPAGLFMGAPLTAVIVKHNNTLLMVKT